MADRGLIDLAAKAAGIELLWPHDPSTFAPVDGVSPRRTDTWDTWNPLTDDGDALRLAVKLRLGHYIAEVGGVEQVEVIGPSDVSFTEDIGADGDEMAATRRTIVRAAAAIGEGK